MLQPAEGRELRAPLPHRAQRLPGPAPGGVPCAAHLPRAAEGGDPAHLCAAGEAHRLRACGARPKALESYIYVSFLYICDI